MGKFSFFPEQASSIAIGVDQFYFFLIAVSIFFAFLIFTMVIFFSIKYRRRSDDDKPRAVHGNTLLELVWTFIPLGIVMVMFAGATHLYFMNVRPPAGALEMFVTGKQWMWKIQHPEGKREINTLHVPLGQAVKLTMTSEDVIHSFYIPAFRVKMDVLPGRYTSVWFNATKAGEYHLFCAEYCGTQHSGMVGKVVVLEPWQYEEWLSGNSGAAVGGSMASKGEALFQKFNCNSCHGDIARAPSLQGLFGKQVELNNGKVLKVDDAYVRESIMTPTAKIVRGYLPLMPTYASQMNEEQVMQLMAYVKSLGQAEEQAQTPSVVAASPNPLDKKVPREKAGTV